MEVLRTNLEREKIDVFQILEQVWGIRGLSSTIYMRRNPPRKEARVVKRITHVDFSEDSSGAEDYFADNDDKYVSQDEDRYMNEEVDYTADEESENKATSEMTRYKRI